MNIRPLLPLEKIAVLTAWVALVAGCGHSAPDPQQSARNFVQALVEGHPEQAYKQTAFSFRLMQSPEAFAASALELNFNGGRVEEVAAPKATDKRQKVEVHLLTSRNEPKRFMVTLVEEKGEWRVLSFRPAGIGNADDDRFSPLGKSLSFNEFAGQKMPDERAIQRLIHDAMANFAQAIANRDFAEFYKRISVTWQQQVTQRQLERAFQEFVAEDVKLQGVAELKPILDSPPVISNEGLLVITGRYPTKPYEVTFTFRYVSESNEWKLLGLDVKLRAAEDVKPEGGQAREGATPVDKAQQSGTTQ